MIAVGSSWSGVLPIANPDGREQQIEFRWEPLAGPGSPPQVAVAARPAVPPGRELLGEVGLRLGTTLDLTEIARQVLDITVPRFADLAGVFVLEAAAGDRRANRTRDRAGRCAPAGLRLRTVFPACR